MSATFRNTPRHDSYEISKSSPGEVSQFFKSHLTYTAACESFENLRVSGYAVELWGLTEGHEPELLKSAGGQQ